MRYLKDIPNQHYKIGLFQWNGKYIVKFEAGGMYEQTYKFDETDFATPEVIQEILDERFVKSITERFQQMHADSQNCLERHGLLF